MAKFVLKNPVFTIDGTDLSAHGSTVSLELETAAQEATTFQGDGWVENLGGLKSGTMNITFRQNFDAGAVDATLWPLFGTVVPFTLKAKTDATSATNPEYQGSILIGSYTPLSGDVGSVANVEVEFPTSGAVTRATS